MGIPGGTTPTGRPCPPHITLTEEVGGPASRSWREGTLTRAKELESLSNWVLCNHQHAHSGHLAAAITQLLGAAREAATSRRRFRSGGPLIQRGLGNLDAAEAHLLDVAPIGYLDGQMPSLLNHVQRHLVASDPRRQEFERIAQEVVRKEMDDRSGPNGGTQPPFDKLDLLEKERGKIVTPCGARVRLHSVSSCRSTASGRYWSSRRLPCSSSASGSRCSAWSIRP